MKKLFNLILVATMSMTTVIGAINTGVIEPTKVYANTNSITVKVDGRTVIFDEQPMIENGSVFVPMRAIFEALGYEVKWDNEFQVAKALLEEENYLIYMNLYGGNQMILMYKEYIKDYTKVGQLPYERLQSETPVEFVNRSTFSPNYTNVNGRILVPVRAISEGTGATVTWDGATKTVLIDSTNPIIKNVETNVSYDVNGAKARVDTYFNNLKSEQSAKDTASTKEETDKNSTEYRFPRGLATLEEHQAEVLRLINLEREKVGVAPLEADPKLMEIAQLKAQEMEDLDYFSHTSPNYGSPTEFVKYYGYPNSVAENIGRGTGIYAPKSSVAMLMSSTAMQPQTAYGATIGERVTVETDNAMVMYGLYYGSPIGSALDYIVGEDGEKSYAYCIDHSKQGVSEVGMYDVTLQPYDDINVEAMLVNGFPNNKYGLTDKQAFYATKMAIVTYLEGWDITGWSAGTGGSSEMISAMNQIFNSKDSYTRPDNTTFFTIEKIEYVEDDEGNSETHTLRVVSSINENITINLNGEVPVGTKINGVVSNNATINTNEDFTISYAKPEGEYTRSFKVVINGKSIS